ncbi:MAG: acyl--CoA ligase [Actinomycetia bacterium]|nr:acyl--CoA ligase [Actinomycetes bacterium]
MANDTPYGWLEATAESSPDAPALFFPAGVVSYRELHTQVMARVRSLRSEIVEGSIVPAVMQLDLPSIIEMLAIMRCGGVLLPYRSLRPGFPSIERDGAAVCIPTSGSSGESQLVPLSYTNISASVAASRERLNTGPDDRWLATLPLDHVGGLSVLWRSLEAGGAAVVSPFGPLLPGFIDDVRPTIASLVPTMVHRLLDWSPDSLASIGSILTGGAGTSSGLLDRAHTCGASIIVTYGLTEASSQVATAIPGSPERSSVVVGPPLDGFSIRILGPHGEVGPGEQGRIEIDGPAVFNGYLGQPPRSEPFLTSDVGFVTEDGSLGVVGRSDDIIVVGGRNVSTRALGDMIVATGLVRDAMVVGIPDPEWGSIPVAIVDVAPPNSLRAVEEALAEIGETGHAPHRWIEGGVPLLPNGKHDRVSARRMFGAG